MRHIAAVVLETDGSLSVIRADHHDVPESASALKDTDLFCRDGGTAYVRARLQPPAATVRSCVSGTTPHSPSGSSRSSSCGRHRFGEMTLLECFPTRSVRLRRSPGMDNIAGFRPLFGCTG